MKRKMKSLKYPVLQILLLTMFVTPVNSIFYAPSSVEATTKITNLSKLNYTNKKVITVNGNKPAFTKADLSLKKGAWQRYKNLDKYQRVTGADALLNQKLMPTKERESIDNVKPTGWKNKKLKNGFLYNRSHLIAYSLTGQNANWKNLMTGTSQLNNPGMVKYETQIRNYLNESKKNYVRYRVKPIFRGTEKLARGVQIQAKSVGDNKISFNVYLFNVQDNVNLNYKDGSSTILTTTPAKKPTTSNGKVVYYAPTSGKKYHLNKNCRGLNRAKVVKSISLSEAKNKGLSLCGWE